MNCEKCLSYVPKAQQILFLFLDLSNYSPKPRDDQSKRWLIYLSDSFSVESLVHNNLFSSITMLFCTLFFTLNISAFETNSQNASQLQKVEPRHRGSTSPWGLHAICFKQSEGFSLPVCLKPRWLMEVRVRRRGIEGVLRREGCYTYPLPGTRRCYTPLHPAKEGCCRCPHPVWEGPWDWSRYLQVQKVTISKKIIFKKRLFIHIFFVYGVVRPRKKTTRRTSVLYPGE